MMTIKRSVLFWLNFSLAIMLKDRLGDEIDITNISLPSFRRKKQVDVTNLEEKNGHRSGPCYYLGKVYIFIQEK